MHLSLNKQSSIADIQAAFHQYFPFLRIAFFAKAHDLHELSAESEHIPVHTLLSEIATFKNEGEYAFTPELTTGEFEQELWKVFGLSVQVMRKSGHVWLQTAITDDWTLAKQNEEAELASHPVQLDDTKDYGLQDIDG